MAATERLRLEISGAVQGVGFRPFVYRLARELGLLGWVINDGRGVFIEVEGKRPVLETFRGRIENERPPRAVIMKMGETWSAAEGFEDFSIRESDATGSPTVVVLPEVATCADCLGEVRDRADRRFRYPFTNCTNCGPRFSIVRRLPYDRPNTTMSGFPMCSECLAEYREPLDRRFHAQPNACPKCGPSVSLLARGGDELAVGERAMQRCCRALRDGRIVAFKGLGGFLLMVDAANDDAVRELRRRKRRDEKPLAIMVPDLDSAAQVCRVGRRVGELLDSAEAPIVLCERLPDAPIAPSVAPGNSRLGIMLPYSPLHYLLLSDFGGPLVATSGNISDEPMCIDNDEALGRLANVADLFLVHDRPIVRHVDDSVVQIVGGEVQQLRRARGWAPLPVRLERPVPGILAVGGHLKNVAALSVEENVFLSQHIGDMETPEAHAAFERVIRDFLEIYQARPVCVARDMHPDYPSSRWVETNVSGGGLGEDSGPLGSLAGLPVIQVQHHHAHLASVLAEHRISGRALGVTWDGTGYGTDGTIWGGEFLVGGAAGYERFASLRPFRLPGGDAAVKQPARVALAVLFEMFGPACGERTDLQPFIALEASARRPLTQMIDRGFRAPVTTSAGRLFDSVASLVGLRHDVAFEGQAAMMLEQVADPTCRDAYPLPLNSLTAGEAGGEAPRFMLDWAPAIEAVLEDSRRGERVGIIAARFHNALAEGIVKVAREAGEGRVALSGGCFQNRLLSQRCAELLAATGFEVLQQRTVPANDGGLSLGQIAVAAARLEIGSVG